MLAPSRGCGTIARFPLGRNETTARVIDRDFSIMNSNPSSAEQAKHFLALLKKFHTGMLITHTTGQNFQARPMAVAEVEDDGRVWFITGADTLKVHQIEADACVHFIAQQGDSAFISLTGRAALSNDRQKIGELWKEPFRVWFPGGRDDPNVELISLRAETGEFWDAGGVNRITYMWEAAKAYITGSTPKPHEGELHGTVKL